MGWVQTFQKSFAGVNDEMSYRTLAFSRHIRYELLEKIVRIEVINSESAFYGCWDCDCLRHRFHTFSNKLGLFHEASSKRPFLNSWRGTPNVEIDAIIAIFLA